MTPRSRERERRDRELEEEIESHIRMAVRDRVARGESPIDAERAVRREFGNRGQVQETTRSMWRGASLDSARRSVSNAARGLRRSPGFTIACVLTLGLGIGGVAAMAALLHAILLEPLPYPDPGRLVSVPMAFTKITGVEGLHSDASFLALQRLNRSAQDIGASDLTEINLSDEAVPERVQAGRVTAGYLRALGSKPLFGRTFRDEEDVRGGPAVVVLSERLWRRRFGADPDLVGRSVQVDGLAHQIVGVMPSSVTLPDPRVQLWLPLAFDPANTMAASQGYEVIARLKPGVTAEAAARDFQVAIDRLPELFPDAGFGVATRYWVDIAGPRAVVRPLRDTVVGDVGKLLWVLLGTAAFVLLVAAANVATLFLVRAEARQREMAVRMALGANRGGLIARFVTEGLLLATLAAGLGTTLAAVGIRLVARSGAANLPRLNEVSVDGPTIALVLLLTGIVGLACGLLPMTRIGTRGVAAMLRSGGRSATGGRDRQRARQLLVVAQVTLAFTLLAGSGLLARTFWQLRSVRPGFSAETALAFRVGLPAATYPGVGDVTRFYQTIEDRLRQLPGVRAVGIGSKLPLRPTGGSGGTVLAEDRPDADLAQSSVSIVDVTGDYFDALGIPVLAGRAFGRFDPARILNEVMVSLQVAKREWGDSTGRESLGRRLRLAPAEPWLTVVGVVGDVHGAALDRPPEPTIYLPTTGSWLRAPENPTPSQARLANEAVPRAMNVVLDMAGGGAASPDAVRAAIRRVDPTVAVFDMMPMSRVLSASLARTTFTGWLLGIAAGMALLLGVIGVYGIVTYTVSLRTREIGLRLALGAQSSQMGMMLARQGLVLVLAGIGAGVVLTLLVSGALRGLLYGVSPNDPVTLGLVGLLLMIAALGASWLPARRAGRIDPASVLSAE